MFSALVACFLKVLARFVKLFAIITPTFTRLRRVNLPLPARASQWQAGIKGEGIYDFALRSFYL